MKSHATHLALKAEGRGCKKRHFLVQKFVIDGKVVVEKNLPF